MRNTERKKIEKRIGRNLASLSTFMAGYALAAWGWEWSLLAILGPIVVLLLLIGALDMIDHGLGSEA